MESSSDLGLWLKLNNDWRDALRKAENLQISLDSQIKHYFDGLGEKPSLEEVITTNRSWDDELSKRQQLFDFTNAKGLFDCPEIRSNKPEYALSYHF